MSARDELTEQEQVEAILMESATSNGLWMGGLTAQAMASTILAAGYRKPRTITTADDLDGLGKGSVILDGNGGPWVNDGDDQDPWCSPIESFEGGPCWFDSTSITLPATVIHEP